MESSVADNTVELGVSSFLAYDEVFVEGIQRHAKALVEQVNHCNQLLAEHPEIDEDRITVQEAIDAGIIAFDDE
jgi:predicted peptidase